MAKIVSKKKTNRTIGEVSGIPEKTGQSVLLEQNAHILTAGCIRVQLQT